MDENLKEICRIQLADINIVASDEHFNIANQFYNQVGTLPDADYIIAMLNQNNLNDSNIQNQQIINEFLNMINFEMLNNVENENENRNNNNNENDNKEKEEEEKEEKEEEEKEDEEDVEEDEEDEDEEEENDENNTNENENANENTNENDYLSDDINSDDLYRMQARVFHDDDEINLINELDIQPTNFNITNNIRILMTETNSEIIDYSALPTVKKVLNNQLFRYLFLSLKS